MDTVREYMQKPLYAAIAGLVLGVLLGWLVIGWWLWPVEWTDAAPVHLRADLQEDYLRMAIDSYSVNRNAILAEQRFKELGAGASDLLAAIQANPGAQKPEAILEYGAVVQGGALPQTTAPPPATSAAGVTPPATAQGIAQITASPAAPGQTPQAGGFLRLMIPILCVVFVLVAAGVVALFLLRARGSQPSTGEVTPAMEAQQARQRAEYTDYATAGAEPPISQFMSSYRLGDDLFDDSFSIDSPSGEFLGECGVGISETIGVGDPKRPAAFEVWLFDKNDIQTVTKVLMSEHAFGDEATRQRLAAKGEPILVEAGAESVLETQTLRLVVRVVDTGYGEGAMPSRSFFDRLILELAVWQKPQPVG
jgi:hypothetical protein